MIRTILFITGTRADYGKIKPLMQAVDRSPDHHCSIFVTGMHTLARYGYTVEEVYKGDFSDIHVFMNQIHSEPMEMVLANTITGLSRYVHEKSPDLIIVHGDRVEALAGAIVGALRNLLVGHIEGGELSGTVDELIRHSVSKLSHLHFVSNREARERLIQLGEKPDTIHVIGSPEIDTMLSPGLPDIEAVKAYHEIPFSEYAIAIMHPVTTEVDIQAQQAELFVNALRDSGQNYVVIYPNNDEGTDYIFSAYAQIRGNNRFWFIPSVRFERFLVLLKNARFVVGNSSVGVRQAPIYGVPSINIGSRQQNRFSSESITHVDWQREAILAAIRTAAGTDFFNPCLHFGSGNSLDTFMDILKRGEIWETPIQKQFVDFHPLLTNIKTVAAPERLS